MGLPGPTTIGEMYLAAILQELKTLNERLQALSDGENEPTPEPQAQPARSSRRKRTTKATK